LRRHVDQRRQHALADRRHRQLAQFEAETAGNVRLFHGGLAVVEQGGLGVVVGKLFRLAAQLLAFRGLGE